MRRLIAMVLFLNAHYLCAEKLDRISSNNVEEQMFSTSNIPDRGSVVVRCVVTLPHKRGGNFSLYAAPLTGDFGQVEIREKFWTSSSYENEQFTTAIAVGSNIPINIKFTRSGNQTADFYILQVKQHNEALIFNLKNAYADPKNKETKIECSF